MNKYKFCGTWGTTEEGIKIHCSFQFEVVASDKPSAYGELAKRLRSALWNFFDDEYSFNGIQIFEDDIKWRAYEYEHICSLEDLEWGLISTDPKKPTLCKCRLCGREIEDRTGDRHGFYDKKTGEKVSVPSHYDWGSRGR